MKLRHQRLVTKVFSIETNPVTLRASEPCYLVPGALIRHNFTFPLGDSCETRFEASRDNGNSWFPHKTFDLVVTETVKLESTRIDAVGDGKVSFGGCLYATKSEAFRAAWDSGYTHAYGSGTYWGGIKAIPARYRN